MKKLILAALAALSLGSAVGEAFADYIYVNPYVRRDGTSVQGHLRSTPNGTCWDNLGGC